VFSVSVPGYEIIDVLGRGGFGVVYRAHQVTIDREVAIKVDSRVILDDRDQRRFLREVRAAGRLSGHPHVVEIYDAGVLPDGRPYLVMELCPGGSLAGRAPLPPPEVAHIGTGIADALAAAHALGVLHRDIKPGNILVKRYGTVGLGDFGLAALIETGRDSSVTLAALTPAYAPPEAFRLEPPSPRSDIYALAATLYALLAGRPPRFPAKGDPSVPEIIRLHDAPVLDLPGVPPQYTAALRRALATDPRHRYADAAEFRAALASLPTAVPHITAPTTVPVALPGLRYGPGSFPSPPARPRRRAGLLAGVALTVVLMLAGAWFLFVRNDSNGSNGTASGPRAGSSSLPASEVPDDTQRFGIPTVTEGCPAAGVTGADARCTERAECWSGIVIIQGEITSIRRIPCEREHVWETYAIAPVPADVADPYQDVLEEHAQVQQVCSTEILLASRVGRALEIADDQWDLTVLAPTPDDRSAGRSVYRCLGTVSEASPEGTAFRPR
jgi:serine/threonine protein kinase